MAWNIANGRCCSHTGNSQHVGHVFQSQVVGVLYINFCKAFDLVDHMYNLLLAKMKVYRFHKIH